MIYQSGYLAIKKENRRRSSFLLDFPNDEMKRCSLTLVANKYLKAQETA